MLYFRKNKKGFTLIELMVVVAIIGVLSLLGLRLYTGQQTKAKEAIVKANAGTVQTLIQSELADGNISSIDSLVSDINTNAGMRNPFDDDDDVCNTTSANIKTGASPTSPISGCVYVKEVSTGTEYYIRGYGKTGLLPDTLTAQK